MTKNYSKLSNLGDVIGVCFIRMSLVHFKAVTKVKY